VEGSPVYDDEDEDDHRGRRFHVLEDEYNITLKLKRVVDLDGNEMAKDYDIKEEYILQELPFKGREPDEEDYYMGYRGNEGASATHFYRDTVIVLMPKEKHMDFLLRPFRDPLSWDSSSGDRNLQFCALMRTVMLKFIRNSKDSHVLNDLFQICQFATEKQSHGEKPFPDVVYGVVVKASAHLRKPDLFRRAVFRAKKLPMDAFPYIGTLIWRLGFSALHTMFVASMSR
jgi:hypothetical protein